MYTNKKYRYPYQPSKYVEIENTRMIYRPNFTGEDTWNDGDNADGPAKLNRFINIIIPTEIADIMYADGWTRIKQTTPSKQYPDPVAFIKAKINYTGNPERDPKIYAVFPGQTPQLLNEDSINAMQDAFIDGLSVQLTHWFNREYGVWSTYVTAMTLFVKEGLQKQEAPKASFLSKFGIDEN